MIERTEMVDKAFKSALRIVASDEALNSIGEALSADSTDPDDPFLPDAESEWSEIVDARKPKTAPYGDTSS